MTHRSVLRNMLANRHTGVQRNAYSLHPRLQGSFTPARKKRCAENRYRQSARLVLDSARYVGC